MKDIYMITYLGPNDYDLVQVIRKQPDLVMTKVLASSKERKYRAFTPTVWNNAQPVEPRLLPTFVGAPYVSKELEAFIKEM